MADLCVNSKLIALCSPSKVLLLFKKERSFEKTVLNSQIDSNGGGEKTKCEFDIDNVNVSADVSASGELLALCSGKTLNVWSLESFELVHTWKVVRSVSKIRFTPGDKGIVLADKSGDVYFYSIENIGQPVIQLLGHLSVILDVLVTDDDKFVITCDRDEKIRVSRFPNSYNIHSYCLGHTEFVSIIELLPHDSDVLLSCSGDETVRFWRFFDGTELFTWKLKDIPMEVSSRREDREAPLVVTCLSGLKGSPSCSFLFISVNNCNGIVILKVASGENRISVQYHSFFPTVRDPVCMKSSGNCLWILSGQETFLTKLLWDPQSETLNPVETDLSDLMKGSEQSFCRDIDILSKSKIKEHLYKKRYDNVQEYLEKKKARLMESVKH